MEKKKYSRSRNINLAFRVSAEEREMIERRMAQTKVKCLRAYMMKMAIDGRVINIELESVNEMVRLLSNATNNINQIAKRATETGNIYAADLDELRNRYNELWEQARQIIFKLSEIKN
jgi:hypothetical protein